MNIEVAKVVGALIGGAIGISLVCLIGLFFTWMMKLHAIAQGVWDDDFRVIYYERLHFYSFGIIKRKK